MTRLGVLASILCLGAFSSGCGGRASEGSGLEPPSFGGGGRAGTGSFSPPARGGGVAGAPTGGSMPSFGSSGSGGAVGGSAGSGAGGRGGIGGVSGTGGWNSSAGGSTSPGGMTGQAGVMGEDPIPVPPDPPPPVDPAACAALGHFDADEVYIMGTLAEGACGYDAIAHWSDPNTALVGFGCYNEAGAAAIRAKDGALIVKETFGRARVFNEDACFTRGTPQSMPTDPMGNDGQFNFPCTLDAAYGSGVALAPRGSMAVQCDTGWYQSSTVLYSGPDEVFAYDGDRFLTRAGVFVIETQTLHPFDGLPLGDPHAWRVIESGFWMLLGNPVVEQPPQLWHVDFEGLATFVGTYPEPPPSAQPISSPRLAGDGALFEIAVDRVAFTHDLIVRRTLSGESDIVYDEGDDPLVKLHISGLVSGP